MGYLMAEMKEQNNRLQKKFMRERKERKKEKVERNLRRKRGLEVDGRSGKEGLSFFTASSWTGALNRSRYA